MLTRRFAPRPICLSVGAVALRSDARPGRATRNPLLHATLPKQIRRIETLRALQGNSCEGAHRSPVQTQATSCISSCVEEAKGSSAARVALDQRDLHRSGDVCGGCQYFSEARASHTSPSIDRTLAGPISRTRPYTSVATTSTRVALTRSRTMLFAAHETAAPPPSPSLCSRSKSGCARCFAFERSRQNQKVKVSRSRPIVCGRSCSGPLVHDVTKMTKFDNEAFWGTKIRSQSTDARYPGTTSLSPPRWFLAPGALFFCCLI